MIRRACAGRRTGRRRFPRTVIAAMVLALVAAVAGCGADDSGSGHGRSRVSTTADGLVLDGRPWWPIGLNAYQLGTDWTVNKGCGAQVDLDSYFGALPKDSVTRFNLFASMVVDKKTRETDYSRLDSIFDAAGRHDQLLVPVLASGEGACEDGKFKDHQWYASGWDDMPPETAPMPYARWLDTAVARWGSSKTLAGWELMGEPEASNCGDASCTWQARTCPQDAARVLRSFFDDAGARLKSLDPDTPVWAGLAGGGQCGAQYTEYADVAASPGIDVLDYHDYSPQDLIPGSQHDGLGIRLTQAQAVGKPLVVAEIGQPAGDCVSLQERADTLAGKVSAQNEAGTAGALFWSFVPDPRLGECTLDIGPGDPMFGVIRRLAP
jgi:mannan endo-1,4-beta-mannosidase